MKREALQLRQILIMASVVGLVSLGRLPLDQPLKAAPGGQQAFASKSSTTETTGDLVFAKLVEFNARRESRLEQYSVRGTYRVENAKGEMSAEAQVEGQPAVSPSVWTKRVDFVRRYQKVGEFWLPLNNQSITRVRIFGKNTLTTEYDNYQINQATVAAR